MRPGVEQLIIAVDELADEFDADELRQLFIVSDRLEAIKCRAVARLDALGAAAADGAINTAQWLRTRAGCSSREASALVKRGRLLNKCPALGTTWADGHLSRGQVECVVAKVTSSREAAFVEQAPELLAALQGLSARDTETALSHWAGKVDAVVGAPPQDRSERSLFLSSGHDANPHPRTASARRSGRDGAPAPRSRRSLGHDAREPPGRPRRRHARGPGGGHRSGSPWRRARRLERRGVAVRRRRPSVRHQRRVRGARRRPDDPDHLAPVVYRPGTPRRRMPVPRV